MDADRMLKVQLLREQVERAEYQVDPRATAAAIVERLLAARTERDT
jgi:anti-sigma28 factor (negative regulator of flagellin synthesis)